MGLTKFPRTLLVIVTEASLERSMGEDLLRLGARGYTVAEVHVRDLDGERDGEWEADRTIRFEVICEEHVADEVASHLLATYGPDYALSLYFSSVQVLRPQRF